MKEHGHVLYAVWVDIDSQVEGEWNRWLDEAHVPEVVAKGGFLGARRFIVREGTAPGKYVTIYEVKDRGTLQKYLDGPAKALREDYNSRYGAKSRASRIVLEQLAAFEHGR